MHSVDQTATYSQQTVRHGRHDTNKSGHQYRRPYPHLSSMLSKPQVHCQWWAKLHPSQQTVRHGRHNQVGVTNVEDRTPICHLCCQSPKFTAIDGPNCYLVNRHGRHNQVGVTNIEDHTPISRLCCQSPKVHVRAGDLNSHPPKKSTLWPSWLVIRVSCLSLCRALFYDSDFFGCYYLDVFHK
jgi:hypothetical protein